MAIPSVPLDHLIDVEGVEPLLFEPPKRFEGIIIATGNEISQHRCGRRDAAVVVNSNKRVRHTSCWVQRPCASTARLAADITRERENKRVMKTASEIE